MLDQLLLLIRALSRRRSAMGTMAGSDPARVPSRQAPSRQAPSGWLPLPGLHCCSCAISRPAAVRLATLTDAHNHKQRRPCPVQSVYPYKAALFMNAPLLFPPPRGSALACHGFFRCRQAASATETQCCPSPVCFHHPGKMRVEKKPNEPPCGCTLLALNVVACTCCCDGDAAVGGDQCMSIAHGKWNGRPH